MPKSLNQINEEAARRILLEILVDAKKPINAVSAQHLLDMNNEPRTWHRFIDLIVYLTGEGLIAAFPRGEANTLTRVEESRFLLLCRQSEFDGPEAKKLMLTFRQKGLRFLEGNEPDVKGVA